MGLVELTKWMDDLPMAVAVDQIARVHARKDGSGRLFAEVHFIGVKRCVAVRERYDQVLTRMRAAEAPPATDKPDVLIRRAIDVSSSVDEMTAPGETCPKCGIGSRYGHGPLQQRRCGKCGRLYTVWETCILPADGEVSSPVVSPVSSPAGPGGPADLCVPIAEVQAAAVELTTRATVSTERRSKASDHKAETITQ